MIQNIFRNHDGFEINMRGCLYMLVLLNQLHHIYILVQSDKTQKKRLFLSCSKSAPSSTMWEKAVQSLGTKTLTQSMMFPVVMLFISLHFSSSMILLICMIISLWVFSICFFMSSCFSNPSLHMLHTNSCSSSTTSS